ncbi:winged helix-turn-helix transcriptional regulator [Paenibacillus tritici]|uniref:Winged helix-turn-helix transcriptional regulator n=1 Tax=Paenibacillus tritici TaxID=1873425 RepID=A0ABX2DY10_9BACL|nr:winged helix-turn-helix domain-containing protein [Paenibacillus tritici]NQX49603.1 winged helix-turn-helix transcriptional regulator [Paenibacillus tritici]QUL55448.1 winged helix-turn-helix transcriptional regulator [Paenibacillus tritici]
MDYKVTLDFAPIYECLTSLNAFIGKQNHNAMDAGTPWVRQVQTRFAPVMLQRMKEVLKLTDNFSLSPYIWSCPGDRTAGGFLNWFESLSAGELYDISGRFGQSVPSNLAGLRDSAAEVIRAWNDGYFSSIDPAIIEGLEQEAKGRAALLDGTNDMEIYEQATEGMRLYPSETLKQVILTPQYHARPLVISSLYNEFMFTSYSCDALPPEEGRPAAALLRLTRALSDETRLFILRQLTGSQLNFTEIVKAVGLSKSTIHYHLIALRAAGLVIVHSSGKSTSYSLRLEALNALPGQIGDYLKG